METLDDPLSSTQVLDDTEELLDNMATDSSHGDSENEMEEVVFAASEIPIFSFENSNWKNPAADTESLEIPSIFVEDVDGDVDESSEGEENSFTKELTAELDDLVYQAGDGYDLVEIKLQKVQVSVATIRKIRSFLSDVYSQYVRMSDSANIY